MTQLETLIQTLCPNGVKFVKLGEVVRVLRGKRLTKSDLLSEALYNVYHGGIEPLGKYNEANREGNTVMVINVGASAGSVGFSKDAFWSSDGCFCLSKNDLTDSKFLYYYLLTQEKHLQSKVRKAGIPTLDSLVIESLQIPLPPLAVQSEIVRILDKFTLYKSELAAELAARLQQYEYYRDQLLTFDDTVKRVKIQDVSTMICSGGTPSASNTSYYNGNIPWLRTQEVDWKDITDTSIKITELGLKNSSAKWIPENCVIVAMYGATAGKVAINKISLTTNQACCNIKVDETKILYRYLFHYLCHSYKIIKGMGQGSQSNINAQMLKSFLIPLPPLSEQERIVSILDRFDALCHDIREGLPAEIDLRQKQYEHYRDKLLTFG